MLRTLLLHSSVPRHGSPVSVTNTPSVVFPVWLAMRNSFGAMHATEGRWRGSRALDCEVDDVDLDKGSELGLCDAQSGHIASQQLLTCEMGSSGIRRDSSRSMME